MVRIPECSGDGSMVESWLFLWNDQIKEKSIQGSKICVLVPARIRIGARIVLTRSRYSDLCDPKRSLAECHVELVEMGS
jgi:hypothetical protein